MTLDSLVAILGLIVAVYQIIPRSRQLDLKLRVRAVDWLFMGLALTAVIYLQFYSFFVAVGLNPRFSLARWNLTPERASFVVILATAVLIGSRMHFAKLSVRRIWGYKRLADELLATKDFPALVALLESHLEQLISILGGQLKSGHVWSPEKRP